MRTTTILILSFILSTGAALAGPFLVCDPNENTDTYDVYMDGVLVKADIQAQADGSLRWDLAGIVPGQYTWTASACNLWGCSDQSNPYISPQATVKPSNLRAVK